MRPQIFVILTGAAAAGLAALAASPAHACSWDYCGAPAYVIPEDAPSASIPANAALLWTPLRLTTDLATAIEQLTLVGPGGETVPIEVTATDVPRFHRWVAPQVVRPLEALVPGAQYTLVTPNTECIDHDPQDQEPVTRTFVAAAAAALPDTLGTLSAATPTRADLVVAEDGACSRTQDTHGAHLTLALDASAAPWADVLAYETVVNGAFWGPSEFSGWGFPTGASWVGRGQDLVFAICNDNPYSEHSYLLPGTHTVKMRARVPGTDVVLETDELTLELSCDGDPADPEVPADPEQGPDETTSGGCAATRDGTPALAGALLCALLVGWRRRRSAA
jgi:hypothetical protein